MSGGENGGNSILAVVRTRTPFPEVPSGSSTVMDEIFIGFGELLPMNNRTYEYKIMCHTYVYFESVKQTKIPFSEDLWYRPVQNQEIVEEHKDPIQWT